METTKSKTKEFNIKDFCDAVIPNGGIDQKRKSLLNELFKDNKGTVGSGDRSRTYVFKFNVEVEGKETGNPLFQLIIGSDSLNNRYKFPFFKKGNAVKYNKIIENCLNTASDKVENSLARCEIKMRKQLFFIRCLHDYLLKEKGETARNYFNFDISGDYLINPNGERISDCKLLKIVFYDDGIINSQKNEYIIERLLRDNNITMCKNNDEEQAITNTFVKQLLCHPLFYYLLNKRNSLTNKFSEPELIKFLINECVILHNDKLLFLPFSEALIARERKNCFTKLATQSSVDPSLFFRRISMLAYTVSKGKGGISFDENRIQKFCKNEQGQVVDNLFNFLITFLDKSENSYKFNSKITRLFFCAHYLAKNFNEYTFFDNLIDCCLAVKTTDNQTKTDPLVDIDRAGFDTIIILSGLVLNMIPEIDKNRFLSYLAEKTVRNFKVKSRKEQIAAIAIISYTALFEWSLIKSEDREKMFKAAFGQTEYSFQIKAAENLLHNDFYKEIIIKHLNFLGDDTYDVQPYYFYYYHHFEEQFNLFGGMNKNSKCLLKTNIYFDIFKPFQFRSDTHISLIRKDEFVEFVKETFNPINGGEESKSDLIIKKLYSSLENDRDKKKGVFLLYSCQALLISIANYERRESQDEKIRMLESQDENIRLLKFAFYCDYYTRKINREYCNGSNKNTDFFLLCGPFRISCLRKFDLSGSEKIKLSDNAKALYTGWLKNETGRYKILLLRLLAYTDFDVESIELPAVTQEDFLDYDNIDAFKIQQDKRAKEENGKYIFGPLEWYKND